MEKRCFKCQQLLPIEQFYAHPQMADGRLNKCIECTKRDVRARYSATRPARQAYERKRFQEPARKANAAKYRIAHRQKHPDKYAARNALNNALRDGRINRPSQCCGCGNPGELEAHHDDYSRPLDVKWFCFKCHREKAHGQVVT